MLIPRLPHPLCRSFSRRALLRRAVVPGLLAAGGLPRAGAAASPHDHAAALAAGDGGERPFVALVHTQAAGDDGPIDDMIAHLNQLSREMQVPVSIIYADEPRAYVEDLTAAAAAGAAVIVATFPAILPAVRLVARRYPKTKFILLYGPPLRPELPNLRTIGYDTYYGMFLAGFFAARVSQNQKLGYIGGVRAPGLIADLNAFKAGAAFTSRRATVQSAFVGSFENPKRGQQIAQGFYAGGIDFIQTDSAETDRGVIAAANQASGRLVSGDFVSQFRLGPRSMTSAVLIYYGQSLATQVSAALIGQFLPGHYTSDLSDGIIDFVPSFLFLQSGPEPFAARARQAWTEIPAVKVAIIAGKIKVPFRPWL
ncbi:BMP family ABC transporter substrate-binding protein [Acidisoma sp. C75]